MQQLYRSTETPEDLSQTSSENSTNQQIKLEPNEFTCNRITEKLIHKETHKGWYSCVLCFRLFNGKKAYMNHINEHKIKSYECTICSQQFRTLPWLEKHVVSYHTHTYIDDVIEEVYGKVIEYGKARDTHHPGTPPILLLKNLRTSTCEVCGERVVSKYYDSHKIRKHSAETYQCTICNKRYNYKDTLRSHLRKHNNSIGTIFRCPMCDKPHSNYASISYHMLNCSRNHPNLIQPNII